MDITVIREPGKNELERRRVTSWPLWEHGVDEFPWSYDATEICYFQEGEVVVTPDGGEPVSIHEGDLVIFAGGLVCTWKIGKPVKKYFNFL